MEDGNALGERNRQVEEQWALPGVLDGLGAEFALAFGGGVRLGGQQFRVQISRLAAVSGRLSQRGAVGCLSLAEQQIVGLAVDPLAGLEAEGLRARTAPPAGWF